MPDEIDDDLYADAVIVDPYTYYGRLREQDPVHWNEQYETWLVSRYADVLWLLRRPTLFSSRFYADDPLPPSPPINPEDAGEARFVAEFRSHEMIQNDPPVHTRMRLPLSRSFTPSSVEQLRPLVRSVVASLLDEVVDRPTFDLRADLAAPLPLQVISEMLGLPAEDRLALREHAERRMRSALDLAPDRMRVAATGIRDTGDYLEGVLAAGRVPAGSLLERAGGAEASGVWDRSETLANAELLIDAGHETTIQLIGNGTLALLRHAAQWRRLLADPDGLAASTTEECLRFDPPLPAPRRLAAADVELGGRTIRTGQRVVFVIAAANRDPRAFEDPDSFDVGRRPNRHLAFGFGTHVCLGQHLARLEGQEMFRALALRLPDLSLAGEGVTYARLRGARSLETLSVSSGRRRRSSGKPS